MKLYDDIERTDDRYSGQSEPVYTFYNRVALPQFARIREKLELWFSHYPDGQDKFELRRRFVSKDNKQHYSALFELTLHEILLKLGCTVDIHPDVPNETGKHPDFLVHHPSGDFYLEAVLISDESKNETTIKKLLGVAQDAINELKSKDFFLDFSIEGTLEQLKTPFKTRELKKKLQSYLVGLNYDEMKRQPYENPFLDDRYKFTYEHEGAILVLRPIRKGEEGRVESMGPIIGASSGPGGVVTTSLSIKKAFVVKGKKYGKLDLPYVVAANILSWGIDIMVPDALYGERGITFQVGKPETRRVGRITEGVWRNKNGTARHTNMSAVLVFGHLIEFTTDVAPIYLHHHPKADMPYQSVLNRFPQFIAGQDGIVRPVEGLNLAGLLGDTGETPQGTYVDFKLGDLISEELKKQ